MSKNNSIFSANYWKNAFSEPKKSSMLVFAALCTALTVVLGIAKLPVAENLEIHFTYLSLSLGSFIYGPVCATLVGTAVDTIETLVNGWGWFPGYLISNILTGVIYGLFLYRQRITVLRLFLARFTVNFGINVGLGCLWSAMLYGKAYSFYFFTSLVKNAVMLIPETALMALFFSFMLPALKSVGFQTYQQDDLQQKFIPFL